MKRLQFLYDSFQRKFFGRQHISVGAFVEKDRKSMNAVLDNRIRKGSKMSSRCADPQSCCVTNEV
jgi:hypothetical protein